jgi:DNA-directed RNA polymerase subunit RPC12/RpoP
MARCSNCNKFVSYDEPQVEVINDSFEDGEYMVEVRIALPCAECGDEMAEANLEDTIYDITCEDCGAHHIFQDGDDEFNEKLLESIRNEMNGSTEEEIMEEYENRKFDDGDEMIEFLESNAEPYDRYEDKTPSGKVIKNPRYQKHFYGANITASFNCKVCGSQFEIEFKVEEQASAFENI